MSLPARHPDPAALHELVDGEAGPARALHLARHLEGCARCRGVRDRILGLANDLSRLPAAEEPAGFADQVMSRVRTMPAPRRRSLALRLVAPAAFLVATVLGVLATPVAGGALRGFGRLLRPDLTEPSRLLELLVGIAAAAATGLGRAVDGLVPHAPAIPALHGPEAPLALLALAALAAVGLAATAMVMLALAGRGILQHRAAKAR